MKIFYFDMDDTIYDMMMPFENAYRDIFGEVHPEIDKLIIAHRKHSDDLFEDSVMKGIIPIDTMYILRIQRACADFGITVSDEDSLRFQRCYEYYQGKISMTDRMKDLFDQLKKTNNFGVITNGIGDHQVEKIGVLGLERWLPKDRIIISGEVGVAKPYRGIFDIAKERIGYEEGDEIYFIGDSMESDIVGAHNAGWKTIWFDRRFKNPTERVEPTYTVNTEEEMIALVRSLNH